MNYLALVIVLIMAAAAAPPLCRQYLTGKAMAALKAQDDSQYNQIMTSLPARIFLSRFQTTYSRLQLAIARNRRKEATVLLDELLEMDLKTAQRKTVCADSLFYFIDCKDTASVQKLLTELRTLAPADEYAWYELLNNVLLEEQNGYIDQVKNRLNQTVDDASAGLLYYLLALQYKRTRQTAAFREAGHKAARLLKHTPYEAKVKALRA